MEFDDIKEFFSFLQREKCVVICEATGNTFEVILNCEENRIIFASSHGYRDCPMENMGITKNHKEQLCIEGFTSVNGWGQYNSPFKGIVYLPMALDSASFSKSS